MNTFRFCPLTLAGAAVLCVIGYRAICKGMQREPWLLICCSMDHPVRQVGEERDRGGCRETDQWPAGLDYCPGAMVTGTNQYYISMIVLYGYNYLGDCLSCFLSVFRSPFLTWAFNGSYLIGKGASRRGQT